jgi:beta/gamma crystallin/peptidase inhibitor family I36
MRRCTTAGFLVAGLFLMGAADASAQTWGRAPTPSTGACFYEDVNFAGQYFCAPIGATNARVPRGTNDRISSIRVFGNADVTVFRDNDFEGPSRRFDFDMRDLRGAGWNDSISSFRIGTRLPGGGGFRGGFGNGDGESTWGRGSFPQAGACFFEDVNFGGRYFCARLGSSTAQVPPGINDQISSIRIFGNAEITVFRDNGFEGRSTRFDDNMKDLRRAGWNDRISSFRISPRGFGGGGNFGGADGAGGRREGNRRGSDGIGLEVFADIGFRGRSAMFSSNTPDVQSTGMAGQISSLRVPSGETWQVCTQADYRGRCQVVTGDVSDLRRGDWNDVIASARRLR